MARALFAYLLVRAKARRWVPQPLTGEALQAHDSVLSATDEKAIDNACEKRLNTLHKFVNSGDLEQALDLHHAKKYDCGEEGYRGLVDLIVTDRSMRVLFPDGRVSPCLSSHLFASATRIGVVGFFVDNHTFVAAPAQEVERVADRETDYVLGTKSILVLPVCPSDADDCDTVFNFGLIQSDHQGDLNTYVDALFQATNVYLRNSSWNQVRLEHTTSPPLRLNYKGSQCGQTTTLAHYAGKDPGAYDVMAFAAVKESYGMDVSEFDFTAILVPNCQSLAIEGVGWIGRPGILLNVDARDYDQSLVHELGHNFGANHASFDANSKGYTAWWQNGNIREYANPFSVMGSARIPNNDASFLVSGALTFDWLRNNFVAYVNLVNCPCEFVLVPVDRKIPDGGHTVAIQVPTSTVDRYLFVEYRASLGGAVLAWADFQEQRGGTGLYGRTFLVDATPDTADLGDAFLTPGSVLQLDLGSEKDPGHYATFRAIGKSDSFFQLIVNDGPVTTYPPTALKPLSAAQSPSPTTLVHTTSRPITPMPTTTTPSTQAPTTVAPMPTGQSQIPQSPMMATPTVRMHASKAPTTMPIKPTPPTTAMPIHSNPRTMQPTPIPTAWALPPTSSVHVPTLQLSTVPKPPLSTTAGPSPPIPTTTARTPIVSTAFTPTTPRPSTARVKDLQPNTIEDDTTEPSRIAPTPHVPSRPHPTSTNALAPMPISIDTRAPVITKIAPTILEPTHPKEAMPEQPPFAIDTTSLAFEPESERSDKKLDAIDARGTVLLSLTAAILGVMSAVLCVRRLGHKVSVKCTEPQAKRCPADKGAPLWPCNMTNDPMTTSSPTNSPLSESSFEASLYSMLASPVWDGSIFATNRHHVVPRSVPDNDGFAPGSDKASISVERTIHHVAASCITTHLSTTTAPPVYAFGDCVTDTT